MTARERPLCDCPEPCTCYAEGYAAGRDKACVETLASLEGASLCRGLRLPALHAQAGLPVEDHDTDGQEFPWALRAGGSLGPGGP